MAASIASLTSQRPSLWTVSIYPSIVFGSAAVLVIALSRGTSRWIAVPAVLVGAALLVLLLERLIPYERGWSSSHGDLGSDLAHNAVNLGINQVVLLVYASLAAALNVLGSLWPSSWPLAGQVVLAVFVLDAGLYAVHRASHAIGWLWALHAVHHGASRLYWLNSERRHPLHHVIEGFPGVTALMLLGASSQVVSAALAILAVHLMLQHSNIAYTAGPLRYLFGVAEVHRWHHRKKHHESQVNFGAVLLIWDHLFGSFFLGRGRVGAEDVGIADEPSYPKRYLEQISRPFTRAP